VAIADNGVIIIGGAMGNGADVHNAKQSPSYLLYYGLFCKRCKQRFIF
jgi:hypothetical protein